MANRLQASPLSRRTIGRRPSASGIILTHWMESPEPNCFGEEWENSLMPREACPLKVQTLLAVVAPTLVPIKLS